MKITTLTQHKQLNTLTTVLLMKVVRNDSKAFGLSQHYEDIVFNDVEYKYRQAFDISAIVYNDTLGIDNGEISGILNKNIVNKSIVANSLFSEADLMAGLWDKAEFTLYEVNFNDLSQFEIKMAGNFGGFQVTDTAFTIELRSANQSFREKQNIQYTNLCRASFCDAVCGLNRENWTDDGVIEEVVTIDSWKDSSLTKTNSQHTFTITDISKASKAVVTAPSHNVSSGEKVSFSGIGGLKGELLDLNGREYSIAYMNSNQFSIDFDSSNFSQNFSSNGARGVVSVVSEYYRHGIVTFKSGNNVNLSFDVISYRPGFVKIFTNGRHIFEIQPGDTYKIQAGCDSLARTCFERFNNKVNFDAEDLLPTADDLMA